MKLVELLARELVEWPETTRCYAQDSCGTAYPYVGGNPTYRMSVWFAEYSRECHVDMKDPAGVLYLELATDYDTAIVTREMWETERMKSAPWFASEPACCHCIEMDVEFPTVSIGVGSACSPEWDGSGLPPVGAVCLGLIECGGEWQECEIVSHHKGSAVAVFPHGGAMASRGIRYRPAPSADQIAANVRNKAVGEMVSVWKRTMGRFAEEERGLAEILYDAGYRKQEKSE